MTYPRCTNFVLARKATVELPKWIPLKAWAQSHFLSESAVLKRIYKRKIIAKKLHGRWYIRC